VVGRCVVAGMVSISDGVQEQWGGPVHEKNGECKKPREKRLRAYAAKAAHRGWGGGGTSTGQSSRSRHRRDGAALWRWRT
jgi:hypothetical protein